MTVLLPEGGTPASNNDPRATRPPSFSGETPTSEHLKNQEPLVG